MCVGMGTGIGNFSSYISWAGNIGLVTFTTTIIYCDSGAVIGSIFGTTCGTIGSISSVRVALKGFHPLDCMLGAIR